MILSQFAEKLDFRSISCSWWAIQVNWTSLHRKTMLPPAPGTFRDREELIKYVRDFGATQGYVVTIKKSRREKRVILGCDRGGIYRNRRKLDDSKRKRKACSRLINCPFEVIGKKEDDVWVLSMKNGDHNHEPLKDMSEHPYCRRFTEEEVRTIKQMTEAGVKPCQVLKALKQSNPQLQSTPRHLYNVKAKIRQGTLSEPNFKTWRPSGAISVYTTAAEGSSSDVSRMLKIANFIGGKFVDSHTSAFYDVLNPSTQEVVSQVPSSSYEEFKEAVAAAKQAFPSWKNTPISNRRDIIFRLQELIYRDIDKLAMNNITEQGMTMKGARADILHGLEVIKHACGITSSLLGELIPNASNGIDTCSVREPLGVCAGICPSNFSAMIPMFLLAVTCGNTFILNPSQKNPGLSLMLAAHGMEAGLPDGVLNIVHGSNDIVNYICDDDDIKALAFVGSNETGMHLYNRAASGGKRVQANMGSRNYAVIMPDACMDATLDAVVAAGFSGAGNPYMSLSTLIFVGGSAAWEEGLVNRAEALKVNGGIDPRADLGPVISKEVKDKICRSVEGEVESGARLILDGRFIVVPGYETGNFVGPTILCDVTTAMDCYKEEILGPVLLCMQADNLDEAITIIGRNKFGHGASIFTTSAVAARRFQNEIEIGLVGINVPVPISLPFSSNGAVASFAGDLNCYGKDGIQFYTKIKTVAQQWKDLPIVRVSSAQPSAPEKDASNETQSAATPLPPDSHLPTTVFPAPAPTASSYERRDHERPIIRPPAENFPRQDPTMLLPTTMSETNLSAQLTTHSTPTRDKALTNQGPSIAMARASNAAYLAQTADRDYIPTLPHRDNNVDPSSQNTYAATSSSESLPLSSQDSVASFHLNSERAYMGIAAHSNRPLNLGLQFQTRDSSALHSSKNSCAPPTGSHAVDSHTGQYQRADCFSALMPTTSMQRTNLMRPKEERLYVTSVTTQRMYNQTDMMGVVEYSEQGCSLSFPTSERI